MMQQPQFQPGKNMAMKVSLAKYHETVHFYRDILLLDVEEVELNHPQVAKTCKVKINDMILWIDGIENLSQKDLWFEMETDSIQAAMEYLSANNVEKDDSLEQLPPNAHWIKDPVGNIILLRQKA
ncbi:glyoxalase [Sphingobacterium sp. UBA6645]|uniref:glyoxalase n=1 Tax=Sphingobacterium sp. UBA6645 TaxID=1947511 RepID=UPI0025E34BBA|nr:glyoxalase [Sphingobacterium sp. UBA6645]